MAPGFSRSSLILLLLFSLVFTISEAKEILVGGNSDSCKEDYETCNTGEAIKEHKDGNTKVSLERAGPFYFISGAKGHCQKGQKLIVVVLSPRRSRFFGVSPAPSPAEIDGPAVAPTSAATSSFGRRSGLLVVLAFGVVLALF
ncbi:hypothetical protein G4B88_024334 [Cannabis sativa]|uniref:Phytocyanin domain-containing protein n=1 Tax=Cannabis sativa TaxID=3483 RepID=A0A7J6H6T3_CANSA|nr:hypothetical protein G4B88_024334 [Cannabis sativa]